MIIMLNLFKPFYPLFFASLKGNPESAHNQALHILHNIQSQRDKTWGRWTIQQLENSFCVNYPRLSQSLWNFNFAHPLGLAPGFDKNAQGAGIWSSFGFSFAELGAVTYHSQEGNPKPRMFRLPADKALLNRMGANNQGAEAIALRLQETWQKQERTIPIGINLCKSKITELNDAKEDYLKSFQVLKAHADYFVINVSSPNTPGLRSLQGGEQLEPILDTLQSHNQGEKPILVKIAPDLENEQIRSIIKVSQQYQLSGLIATNTTIKKEGLHTKILNETGKPITEEAGGISGLPLRQRSTEVIRFIYRETEGKLPIIGVGGIFDTESAWEKITAGATLLQFYSGWVYQGPWIVPDILQGLSRKLEENNLDNLSQAVGIGVNN
ncbi:quinone-dependent dihydroorotate dehydrogenase [Cyanobacterium aponinum UTEX 3222]|uniref:quinone-dependent dihydroorotate dehydrogenase n=1 Tax=Cyanobacterium aponinum TaxID=379064 RepID=UPI002B4BEECB|nr:quinone-dependent dihydroorotate dehydrogenase [Cyanobacterium aponinum]WRL40324.1 quinone-dependent dihydroorotate dehydrogenase [Cyanobacterium aponinum UTEX 3221]WRL44055.1 quinone-dependent dihydroorotate dehydrogenase [Cyanobacterium aponinum UTEX 3222]